MEVLCVLPIAFRVSNASTALLYEDLAVAPPPLPYKPFLLVAASVLVGLLVEVVRSLGRTPLPVPLDLWVVVPGL